MQGTYSHMCSTSCQVNTQDFPIRKNANLAITRNHGKQGRPSIWSLGLAVSRRSSTVACAAQGTSAAPPAATAKISSKQSQIPEPPGELVAGASNRFRSVVQS